MRECECIHTLAGHEIALPLAKVLGAARRDEEAVASSEIVLPHAVVAIAREVDRDSKALTHVRSRGLVDAELSNVALASLVHHRHGEGRLAILPARTHTVAGRKVHLARPVHLVVLKVARKLGDERLASVHHRTCSHARHRRLSSFGTFTCTSHTTYPCHVACRPSTCPHRSLPCAAATCRCRS